MEGAENHGDIRTIAEDVCGERAMFNGISEHFFGLCRTECAK
jgi:hypothetical protein